MQGEESVRGFFAPRGGQLGLIFLMRAKDIENGNS